MLKMRTMRRVLSVFKCLQGQHLHMLLLVSQGQVTIWKQPIQLCKDFSVLLGNAKTSLCFSTLLFLW